MAFCYLYKSPGRADKDPAHRPVSEIGTESIKELLTVVVCAFPPSLPPSLQMCGSLCTLLPVSVSIPCDRGAHRRLCSAKTKKRIDESPLSLRGHVPIVPFFISFSLPPILFHLVLIVCRPSRPFIPLFPTAHLDLLIALLSIEEERKVMLKIS